MQTVKLNNCELGVYDSIKELPISLSKKMQMYLLQQSGIGSTVHDVDIRLSKAIDYLQAKETTSAINELKNVRLAVFSCLEQIDFRSLAFACMVKKVDGVEIIDYSQDNLDKLINEWSDRGLTNEIVSDIVDEVKKNLT